MPDNPLIWFNIFIIDYFSMIVTKVTSNSSGSCIPKLAAILPCASASIKRTLLPSLAKPIPKLTQVVVFPTPPFDLRLRLLYTYLSSAFLFFYLCIHTKIFCSSFIGKQVRYLQHRYLRVLLQLFPKPSNI